MKKSRKVIPRYILHSESESGNINILLKSGKRRDKFEWLKTNAQEAFESSQNGECRICPNSDKEQLLLLSEVCNEI